MNIYDDYTNVFKFAGINGYGPGNHNYPEILSSLQLTSFMRLFNSFSYLSYYSFASPEGHYSMFFGNIVFKAIDSTMSGFLSYDYGDYGIVLERDTTDATNLTELFNQATNTFEIPLNGELVFEPYDPYVRLSCVYNNPTLYRYRPQYTSYSYTGGRVIKFQLIDVVDNTAMDYTTFNSLSDYDLSIHILGYRTIYTEDL